MTTKAIEKSQTDALQREQFLKDVLVGAVEGGTGYWAQVSRYDPDKGTVILHEIEDETHAGNHPVTLGTIERGIRRIIAGEMNISRSIREDVIVNSVDNDFVRGDAETADCIMQAGIFGEIVYG